VRGDPYHNMVHSMSRVPVALVYVLANIALAVHLYHGAWSLFQSMGWSWPGHNDRRRWFAIAFATIIAVGNVSFPIAVVAHITAAYQLTMINRRARPEAYRSKRDYVAADFASRTMRWTGIIVALFVIFHLLDLTWGPANPDFVEGDPYHNIITSFERVPVALIYVIANLALGVHLYHGAWSLFQSMGWVGAWRRQFATVFAAVIVVGNVSFPLAVMFGVVN